MDNVVPFDSASPRPSRPWQDHCLRNSHNAITPTHFNAMLALRFDPDLRDVFGYDEMQQVCVVLHEIGRPMDIIDRWVSDKDVSDVVEWMQGNGLNNIGHETVRNAVMARAHENAFHPVRDYLRSLMWDEVPRLGVWLTSYLGAEMNAYNAHIGRMFLTSMVARVIEPGCQVDHMPVLEGPQGVLKSSACRVLGGKWFSDHLPDVGSGKEVSQHLRGKWIIEVSEMHAMTRAEATLLKSFISRTHERYRPVYGRVEVIEPRQCVFVGTTNQTQYLKDPTGGRRFWPVRTGIVGPIQLPLLAEYRDMLLAEALVNYQTDGTWWPDQHFETMVIKPEQADRYAGADIWEDLIADYLAANQPEKVIVAHIAKNVLGIPDGQQRQEHAMRIIAILRELGYEPRRTGTRRWWEKGHG